MLMEGNFLPSKFYIKFLSFVCEYYVTIILADSCRKIKGVQQHVIWNNQSIKPSYRNVNSKNNSTTILLYVTIFFSAQNDINYLFKLFSYIFEIESNAHQLLFH